MWQIGLIRFHYPVYFVTWCDKLDWSIFDYPVYFVTWCDKLDWSVFITPFILSLDVTNWTDPFSLPRLFCHLMWQIGLIHFYYPVYFVTWCDKLDWSIFITPFILSLDVTNWTDPFLLPRLFCHLMWQIGLIHFRWKHIKLKNKTF